MSKLSREERKKMWIDYVIAKSFHVDTDQIDKIIKEAEEMFDEFNPII